MKHTGRQATTKTLTDLLRALKHRFAVTITYQDEDGTETLRTIEPYDVRTTKSGSIRVHAMCRLRGDARSFDVARIVSYTRHRIAFVLDRPEATTPAGKGIVVRSEKQLIARELGRDYLPARRIVRTDTALAA
jgi:predicted DNA-binding transcriptional regulator YafY